MVVYEIGAYCFRDINTDWNIDVVIILKGVINCLEDGELPETATSRHRPECYQYHISRFVRTEGESTGGE